MRPDKRISFFIVALIVFCCAAGLFADSHESLFAKNMKQLLADTPKSTKISVINICGTDIDTALNIADELEYIINDLGFLLINHEWLEHLPYFEKNYDWKFKFNEAITDDFAYEMGNVIKTDIALIGRFTETDSSRKLVLKALDFNSKKILGSVTCEI